MRKKLVSAKPITEGTLAKWEGKGRLSRTPLRIYTTRDSHFSDYYYVIYDEKLGRSVPLVVTKTEPRSGRPLGYIIKGIFLGFGMNQNPMTKGYVKDGDYFAEILDDKLRQRFAKLLKEQYNLEGVLHMPLKDVGKTLDEKVLKELREVLTRIRRNAFDYEETIKELKNQFLATRVSYQLKSDFPHAFTAKNKKQIRELDKKEAEIESMFEFFNTLLYGEFPPKRGRKRDGPAS